MKALRADTGWALRAASGYELQVKISRIPDLERVRSTLSRIPSRRVAPYPVISLFSSSRIKI